MPRAKQAKCPNCNAGLPIDLETRVVRCKYCGNEVLLEQLEPSPGPGRRAGPRISPLLMLLPIAAIVVLVAAAVMITKIGAQKASRKVRSTEVIVTGGGPAPLPSAGSTEYLNWLEHESVVTAKVNGDEIDDLVVLATISRPTRGSQIYLLGIDGATGAELWRSESLGDVGSSNALGKVHFAVRGSKLVITDRKRDARVHDLATLKLEQVGHLTDAAEWICTDVREPNRVWIEVKDKNHVMLDLTSGAVTLAKRPRGCLPWHERVDCRGLAGTSRCISDVRRFQRATGYRAAFGAGDGDAVVTLGHKLPGSLRPMVAGYTGGKKRKLAWTRYLVEDPDADVKEGTPARSSLSAGRLIVYYQQAKAHHYLAIDAGTGKTLWDVQLPRAENWAYETPKAIAASPTRIFVLRQHIFILDPASGEVLKRLPNRRKI